jgi:hypothetical protein
MKPLRPIWRRIGTVALLGVAALSLVIASAELGYGLQGSRGAWVALVTLLAATTSACVGAIRLHRGPRSAAAVTGHLVLFEWPMLPSSSSDTPALTVRGPRDAIERFIPVAEFGALFGGYAMWHPADHPTHEMPGEALGVWSRRVCQRFRRILRERGATVEVRRERGPAQRLARLVTERRG